MEMIKFNEYHEKALKIVKEIKKVILGKDEVIAKILATVLAGGHVLLDDIPGVGKTTLALAFSLATNMEYRRLQFTPDVLPTDVTGFSVYDNKSDSFKFKPGAAVCNLFLADEINRTSSKTQSALLEIMEEGRVTVDGITRDLPDPFIVVATQNPIGFIGTQMLPESQLDRFMTCLSVGYPDTESEIAILKERQSVNPLDSVVSVADAKDIVCMREIITQIYTDDKIYAYIAAIAEGTRKSELFKLGVSPRGTLALARASRAVAFLNGRDYVVPDDVVFMVSEVLSHRVVLSTAAKIEGASASQILDDILKTVPMPKIDRQ